MTRTTALIKGLIILHSYGDAPVTEKNGHLYAGPPDHRIVLDTDANELEDMGWYATPYGWAFDL